MISRPPKFTYNCVIKKKEGRLIACCDVVSFGMISMRYVQTSPAKNSVCIQGSRECCAVCVRIPELFVRVSTAVQYATKYSVTSHDTSTGLLGTFQALNIGE